MGFASFLFFQTGFTLLNPIKHSLHRNVTDILSETAQQCQ